MSIEFEWLIADNKQKFSPRATTALTALERIGKKQLILFSRNGYWFVKGAKTNYFVCKQLALTDIKTNQTKKTPTVDDYEIDSGMAKTLAKSNKDDIGTWKDHNTGHIRYYYKPYALMSRLLIGQYSILANDQMTIELGLTPMGRYKLQNAENVGYTIKY